MIQSRAAHLSTYLTVKKSNFDYVAGKLLCVSPEILKEVVFYLRTKQKIVDLSIEQRDALDFLSRVNIVNSKVPGLQASKLWVCNSIRSYFTHFGLPHIYLTMNPAPNHSPVFHLCLATSKSILPFNSL